MKSIILQVSNLTFMVNGISNSSDYVEQRTAFLMIFNYLKSENKIECSLSEFLVNMKIYAFSLKDTFIESGSIKGTLNGSIFTVNIDTLVILDIADAQFLNFQRFEPHTINNENSVVAVMKEEPEGNYVSYSDYVKLLDRLTAIDK